MATEQSFEEPIAQYNCDSDVTFKKEWKTLCASAPPADNANGGFDCNICFESAQDPVVTLCGHLYCWPCIYKWLNVQSSSPESVQQPNCPICKADISHSSLVPLYGHGSSSNSKANKPDLGLVIPHRPSPCGLHTLIATSASMTSPPSQQLRPNPLESPSMHHQQYFPASYGSYDSTAASSLGGMATLEMLRELVYARVFGSLDTNLVAYPNSYHLVGSGSPRLRRQEMEVDKSLNRVSIFLFCCFVLCLLLF